MIRASVISENTGRFLRVRSKIREYGMEVNMIGAIKSPNIINPVILSEEDEALLDFDITECINLKEYLHSRKLREGDIINLMIGLLNAAKVMADHLMGEENLILCEELIFIDKYSETPRFCAIPEPAEDIRKRLRELAEVILLGADSEDDRALRLSAMLFRDAAKDDVRVYDLRNTVILAGKGRPESCPAAETAESADAAEAKTPTFVPERERGRERGAEVSRGQHAGQYRSEYTVEDLDRMNLTDPDIFSSGGKESFYVSEDENEANDARMGFLRKILLSQAILLSALAGLVLFKGQTSFFNALPVYLLLSVCIAVYFWFGASGGESEDELGTEL